jgi:hypothetical protein
VELGGVAAVEVLHHGIEAGDFLAAFEEEDADALGAFEALEVVGGVGEVFVVDGVAVGAEVLDEVGGDEVAGELGAEGGIFGELGCGVQRNVLGLKLFLQLYLVRCDGDFHGGVLLIFLG